MATRGRPINVQTFLRREFDRGSRKFTLHMQHQSGSRSKVLATVTAPEEASDDIVEDWAAELESVAQNEANVSGGTIAFAIYSWHGDSEGPRHPFRLQGESDETTGIIEAPSQAGLLGQLMRHNEAMARSNAAMVAQMASMTAQILASSMALTDKLSATHGDALEALHESATRNRETSEQTEIARMEIEAHIARTEVISQQVGKYLPMIVEMVGPRILAAIAPKEES